MTDTTNSVTASSTTTTTTTSQDIDPNTLWHSPFARTTDGSKLLSTAVGMVNRESGKIEDLDSGRALSKESEEAMQSLNRLAGVSIPDAAPMLLRVQQDLKKRWRKYKSAFLEFWEKMRVDSREYFLMDVSPYLYYSNTDRYCVINGKKKYDPSEVGHYHRKMLLVPYMTVQSLANGENDLVWLLTEICETWRLEDVVADMVVQLREIFNEKLDQRIVQNSLKTIKIGDLYSSSEKKKGLKQKNVKKNEEMVFNCAYKDTFGQYILINDPKRTILGANLDGGTPVEGTEYERETGIKPRVNLYEWGMLSHPFEYEEAVGALAYVLLNVGQYMDEFCTEVLGSMQTFKSIQAVTECLYCANSDPDIKKLQCSRCRMAMYCSATCQKKHWKEHKKVCNMVAEKKLTQS